jgi:hypothetical protein
MSIYDKFDLSKPNVYITHAMLLNNDVMLYLVENKGIDVIMNISGLNQEQLSQTEALFSYHDLKSVLFFINYSHHGLVSKNFNIFTLPHCADIYLGINKKMVYNIENGILVSDKSQISKREGTYHYIAINRSLSNDVDICMSTPKLSNIYPNYDRLVIKPFKKVVPQYFYDAIFYGKSVVYEADKVDDPMIDILNRIFKDLDPLALKTTVQNKHTCLNRTKSLLSQLPCNDIVIKLGKMMETLKWE